jgi:heme exporter protein CcmD
MIELGRHGGYILASYAAAAVIFGAIIVQTILAFRQARRRLAALDRADRRP